MMTMLKSPPGRHQDAPRPAATSVSRVDQVADLVAIFEDSLNVCVLRRDPALAVERFVRSVLCAADRERTLRIKSEQLDAEALLAGQAGHPDAPAFVEDVRFLAQVYEDLSGAEEIGLRLVSSHQPLCPRFHVDRVGVRLICTYSGPGTEFLCQEDVDRRWLGHRADGRPDEASGLLRTPDAVQRMQPFDIGLLKGEAWPGNHGRGAVHRSPPVAPSDTRRVFVTIEGL
jgi:hypothetical protein